MPREQLRESPREAPSSLEENEWVLPTDITLVQTAINVFKETLRTAEWDKDSTEYDDAQNVFNELLSNAIAHGNLGVEKPPGSSERIYDIALREQKKHPEKMKKKVYVNIKVNAKKLIINIRDEGIGFDLSQFPDPTHRDNLLKTSGRGIYNIKTLHHFDSLGFDYSKGGTEVTAVKEIK